MFAATVDILDDSRGLDRRAGAVRMPLAKPSTLRAEDRVPLDITVIDLSSRGFRFRSPRTLSVGMHVRVGLGGAGTQDGEIVWRDGADHGCVFHEPLSRQRLTGAFDQEQVVVGHIGDVRASEVYFEAYPRWPLQLRAGTLFGGSALAWAAVYAATRIFVG